MKKKESLFTFFSFLIIFLFLIGSIIIASYSAQALKCEDYSYENCPDSCIRLKEPSCQVPCTVYADGSVSCLDILGCNGTIRCLSHPSNSSVQSNNTNVTICTIPVCAGAYKTEKIDEQGCPIYDCLSIRNNSCTDSDGGKKYEIKGEVSVSLGSSINIYFDNCDSDNILREYYCEDFSIKNEAYSCNSSCKDGACIKATNSTACEMPVCAGAYKTGKKNDKGCYIYTCPSRCEDYSYNECPSGCEKKTVCLAQTCKEGEQPCLDAPCQILCATPNQKKVYLNQKFELKSQEIARVVNYKNMEIKYIGMLCASSSCRENEPCLPTLNPCKLHLQVSMSYSEGAGTSTSTKVIGTSTTSATSTTSTGSDSSGSGTSTVGLGRGVGTVFDLAPGEKKEVFGATISLLRLDNNVAILVVEEQIIIKPICGNGFCEVGEGEICKVLASSSDIFCGEGEECKIPSSECKYICAKDCLKRYEPIPISLNEKFKLHIGQKGVIKDENIEIIFKNMIASKCKEEVVSSQASAVAIKEKVAEAEKTLTGSVVSDLSTDKPVSVLKCTGSGPKALISYQIAKEKGNYIKGGVLEIDLREKKRIGDIFSVAFLDYDYASRTGVFLINKEEFICPERCKCDIEGNTISCPDKRTCEEGKILCPDGECRDKCLIVQSENCTLGCNYEGSCFPMGIRSNGMFCGTDLAMNSQKNNEQICENNFECSSNVCVAGKCISKGLVDKIIDFFRQLFGSG